MTGPGKIPLDITRGYLIRRGAIFGAALGMLGGLIDSGLAAEPAAEPDAIVRWRNFILGGTVVGLVVGIFWPKPAPPDGEQRIDS